jgi:hypothetical protein
MHIKTFIKQCHEHQLFKMLSIYIVSSWVILQVLSITYEPLGLPKKSVTFLIIILLISLPLYLLIIWKYKIIPLEKERLEIKGSVDGDPEKAIIKSSFKKYYLIASVFITSICAFVTFFIIDTNFINHSAKVSYLDTDRIAVLKFGNNTGDEKYDDVGEMASNWILHGITENKLGQVISPEVINQYNTVFSTNLDQKADGELVKKYLKPAKIITGNYFLKNENLVFQATLIDGKTDKTIYSFKPVDCLEANPLGCIEKLEATINGFFATEGKKKLMLQETPPNYEAYSLVLESNNVDYDENYLTMLESAIALDSNYFEPKALRVAYHYNMKNFFLADSLLKKIKIAGHRNARQINLINMYDGLLKGDNKKAYQANLNEYESAPFDLSNNSSAMTVTLQFVNKANKVDSIYNEIKSDSLNLANCYECINRIYVKSLADIELKKYAETKRLLENAMDVNDSELLREPYLSALIRNGNDAELKKYLIKIKLTESQDNYAKLSLYAGKEYLLVNKTEKAKSRFDEVLNTNNVSNRNKAFANLYLGNYKESEKEFKALVKENPLGFKAHSALAISNYKVGNESNAKLVIENLEKLRKPFQFGEIDYSLAQYYAVTKDTSNLYKHLLKAVASGYRFKRQSYKNDLFFKDYRTSLQFKQVLQFWH